MTKGGVKVCPRCLKPLKENARLGSCKCPPPSQPTDVFRKQVARAYDDPEQYQKFIDGLARKERLRLVDGIASLRPPEVQHEIDALVLLASPLNPAPRARPPTDVVRRQQLTAFVVFE